MQTVRLHIRAWALALSLAAGCAAPGGTPDDQAEGAEAGKADSPYSEEGGPCVSSFDCELGYECGGGVCVPRDTSCGDRR